MNIKILNLLILQVAAQGAPQSESEEAIISCLPRQILSGGQCVDCPVYHQPSADKKSCYVPECPMDQILTAQGVCANCPAGDRPAADQRKCISDDQEDNMSEDNELIEEPDQVSHYAEMAERALVESTSELRSNLESISDIVSSTIMDQQIWLILQTNNDPRLDKVKKQIKRLGLGFSKVMYQVKCMADNLYKGMEKQEKVDYHRDKIDSKNKLTVEKDIKMFFKILKGKLKMMNFQSKKIQGISKQLKRLLSRADKISMKVAEIMEQDQDMSFQLIGEVLDDFVAEYASSKFNINELDMPLGAFVKGFKGSVNEENFGTEEERDAVFDKYDEITDQMREFAKQISDEAMSTKGEMEAILSN